ncbi:MAG: MCP four helix bundle domain-containing protein, partial [Synergistaceae bacterium]|nr:MCP four helix bundle domain-containing protein [Synergistaceae bacterium]
MLKNLKIATKLAVGFGLVLALFGVAVFLSWVSISAVQKEIAFLQQVSKSLDLANHARDSVSWIRAGIRDLHYSESEEDIEKLQTRITELQTHINAIRQLYSEQPRLVALSNVKDMEQALSSGVTNLDKLVALLRTKAVAIKKLDEDILTIQAIFKEIVDLQYKRAYAEVSVISRNAVTNPEGGMFIMNQTSELRRTIFRVKSAEDMMTALVTIAWHYQEGMMNDDIEILNNVTELIKKLDAVVVDFSNTTKVA